MTTRTQQDVAALGRRRRRLLGFDVRRLYLNGEAGAVYDPSDLTPEKVAWRRNLLTWSEDFTNAVWTTVTNVTVSSNTTLAPDNTTTADTVTETSTTGGHYFSSGGSSINFTAATTYTLSVFAKNNGRRFLQLYWGGGTSSVYTGNFDLQLGVVGTTSHPGAAGSSIVSSIADAGNGWYRCVITLTTRSDQSGATSVIFVLSNSASASALPSYTGDGTSGVFLWGAQLEVGATATAYQRITDFTSDFLAAFPTHALYQDSAGTTPVTALGQPVGLVLDTKTGGLANLGPELVTNGNFSNGTTGWSAPGGQTFTVVSGQAKVTNPISGGAYVGQGVSVVTGTWYAFTYTAISDGTSKAVGANIGNAVGSGLYLSSLTTGGYGFGTRTVYWCATVTGTVFPWVFGATPDANAYILVDDISFRAVPGNHAIQATSASRPLLDARVNLLTYSEQFDNAAWSKNNSSITANAAVAPDGTTTADKLVENTANAEHLVFQTCTSGIYLVSVYAKADERSWLRIADPTGARVWYNLSNGTLGTVSGTSPSIVDAGNGWYRCSYVTGTATNVSFLVANGNGVNGYTGDGTSGILIWGADLRLATDAAYPYQRVTTATDYADVGVPRSFAFDGVDDSLYTASNMDLSGTDKVTVLAGVRKLSDAALFIAELSANTTLNNGSFGLYQSGATVLYGQRGTIFVDEPSAASYAAPTSVVVTGVGNISGDATTIRTNGIAVTDTSDLGTGNFGSYVLFIGRRNNASLPFNGKLYQLIVRGAATDAGTLVQAERYVAQRTGITL